MLRVMVRFAVPGFHHWPDAPEEVAHLRDRHRHLFRIQVEVRVWGFDREVEFQIFQRQAIEAVSRGWQRGPLGFEFGSSSCEAIAVGIMHRLQVIAELPVSAVEVWEDGENGVRIEEEDAVAASH